VWVAGRQSAAGRTWRDGVNEDSEASDAIFMRREAFERFESRWKRQYAKEPGRCLLSAARTHFWGGEVVIAEQVQPPPFVPAIREIRWWSLEPDDFKFWSIPTRPACAVARPNVVAPGEPVLLSSVQLVVARKPEGKGIVYLSIGLEWANRGQSVASIFGRRLWLGSVNR